MVGFCRDSHIYNELSMYTNCHIRNYVCIYIRIYVSDLFIFYSCTLVLFIFIAVDNRPEIKFLNRHMREPLCAKSTGMWKDLGLELLGTGSNDSLDAIKNNNSDIRNCCSAMFQLWLDRQPTASWRQLIEALKQLQLNFLAYQIESKLIIPVLEPSAGL